MVMYEHPLLFESGQDQQMDIVLLVTAHSDIQKSRALARPGMNEKKLAMILAQQMPQEEKSRRADQIIDTSNGLEPVQEAVTNLLRQWKNIDKNRQ